MPHFQVTDNISMAEARAGRINPRKIGQPEGPRAGPKPA
jgi:hypothetical protein